MRGCPVALLGGFLLLTLVAGRLTAQPPAEPSSATPSAEAAVEDSRQVAAKVVRYAQRFINRNDRNHNGRLEREEWPAALAEKLGPADLDHDGSLSVDEYARLVSDYGRQRRIRLLPPQPGDLVELPALLRPTTAALASTFGASPVPLDAKAEAVSTQTPQPRRDTRFSVAPDQLPKGLPDWFAARDQDGDGQLTVAEFSPKGIPAELQQFQHWDSNGDGVVTPEEYLAAVAEKKAASKP